jgi:hypothetical protein
LVATGGSDDHGSFNDSGLGSQTTPAEEYERLLSQATGAHPATGQPTPGEPR